jgi:PAS domain S-box-containing protein
VADVPASVGIPTHADVLDQVDLAIIATDAEGIVTTWNARAEAVYGWTRDEAVGRPISELTVAADSEAEAAEIMERLAAGESWQGPFRVKRKDGTVFTTFVRNSPLNDGNGGLIGVVGVSIELEPHLADAIRAVSSVTASAGRRARVLSPREREILGLLARGLTGEQIAERLVLSPETIRTHIRNAREKLGASTRVEAVTMALLAQEIQL